MPRSVKRDILYPFATLSLIAVVLAGVALAVIIGHDIETRMRGNAADVTAASVVSALQPHINGIDLQTPLTGATYDQLQQAVSQNILSGETLRLRIYNRQGTTVYSTNPAEVGRPVADESALNSAFNSRDDGSGRRHDGGRWGRRGGAGAPGLHAALFRGEPAGRRRRWRSTRTTWARLPALLPHGDGSTSTSARDCWPSTVCCSSGCGA